MIKTLFPTFIYSAALKKDFHKLNSELLDEAYKFAELDIDGQKWSKKNYIGGYTSYGSLSTLNKISSTFEELEKSIDKHVAKFVKHLEMDIHPKELKMTSCWINIMPPSVIHSYHIHPLSVISGTYYVQTPKNCSAIKFEDPRAVAFMASPPRKHNAKVHNQRYHSVEPKPGNIVLFESWLKHEVPQNQAKDERVSISFNYDWI